MLEEALAANTAALNEVAELLRQSNAGREAALAQLTAGAGESTTKAARKPRGQAATPPESPAPESAEKNGGAPPPAPPPPTEATEQDVRDAAVKFMSFGPDGKAITDPVKVARKAFLAAMNQHLGTAKIVECEGADRARVIGWFEQKAAGQEVNFSDGEDDGASVDEDDIG